MSRSRFYKQEFRTYMHALGYDTDPEGMCFGIAHMAMQASLTDELENFNKRLIIIHKLPYTDFANNLTTLKQKRNDLILSAQVKIINSIQQEASQKNKLISTNLINFSLNWMQENPDMKSFTQEDKVKLQKKIYSTIHTFNPQQKKQYQELYEQENKAIDSTLTPEELQMLSTPAFFDGVALYHQARKYPWLYKPNERPITQDQLNITKQINIPKKIEDQKMEIVKTAHFNGVYNENELINYFTSLRQLIFESRSPFNQPISLVLTSSDHAISVGYNPNKKCWEFIDANNLPALVIKDEIELAKEVKKAFENDTVMFTTNIYVADSTEKKDAKESQETNINKKITEWQKSKEWLQLHDIESSEAKSKANMRDAKGCTLLHIAAKDGDFELVKKLVEAKADVNAKSNNLTSPLYSAVNGGHVEIVKFLIEKGANPHLKNKENNSALVVAAELGNHDMAFLLLRTLGASPNILGKKNQTPLGASAQHNHPEMVQLLLTLRADPNYKEPGAVPALVSAMAGRNIEIIKILLRAKADPNGVVPNLNISPLHIAIQLGEHKIATELLEHKANVNALFKADTNNLLKIAQDQGNYDNACDLILRKNKGSLVLPSMIDSMSALHLAIWCGDLHSVKLLLDKKADINQKILGFNAIDLANLFKNKEIINLLDTHMKANSFSTTLYNKFIQLTQLGSNEITPKPADDISKSALPKKNR